MGTHHINHVFEALANKRRRYTLYILLEREQGQVEDLAVQIVAWERGTSVNEVPSEIAERVRAELVHSHLPKLEDYGLIEYDRRSGVARYAYPPSFLDNALELAATIEQP